MDFPFTKSAGTHADTAARNPECGCISLHLSCLSCLFGALGSLTVEGEAATRRVLSSAVLRYTLIGPGVLLLEIWNFQYSVGVPHLDFAGERNATGSSPAYFRNRALTKGVER